MVAPVVAQDGYGPVDQWACGLLDSIATARNGAGALSDVEVLDSWSGDAAGLHSQFPFYWQDLEAVWAEFPPVAHSTAAEPVRQYRPLIRAAWTAGHTIAPIECPNPELIWTNAARVLEEETERLAAHAVGSALPPDHPDHLTPVRPGPCNPTGLQSRVRPISVSRPVFDTYGQRAALFVNGMMTVYIRRGSRWTEAYSLPHFIGAC